MLILMSHALGNHPCRRATNPDELGAQVLPTPESRAVWPGSSLYPRRSLIGETDVWLEQPEECFLQNSVGINTASHDSPAWTPQREVGANTGLDGTHIWTPPRPLQHQFPAGFVSQRK